MIPAPLADPLFRFVPYWIGLFLVCCGDRPAVPPSLVTGKAVPTGKALIQLASRFESDTGFRRNALENSLVNKGNGYSKIRLTHYHPEGWGRLPVAAFKTRPVRPADLGKPVPTPDGQWTASPASNGPVSEESLRQKGEQMFTVFPAQVERSMIPVLRDKAGPARYGLWQTDTSVGGLVWVALPGGVFPALTCSSCHSSVDEQGNIRHGVPNHQIDLGKAKDDYIGRRSLYTSWGPGRVDIAADGKDNPVVVADVRAVRFQSHIHRTANIENSLVNLALRVETGLILAHRRAVRPLRKDAFALAYYLWTLGNEFDTDRSMHHPDRKTFEQHCGTCHQGPSHSGKPIVPASIKSPVAMLESASRGTGKIRTPSLLGVSERKRLLYGGEAKGLDDLLSPERQQGGHTVGRSLSDIERRAVKNYLNSI